MRHAANLKVVWVKLRRFRQKVRVFRFGQDLVGGDHGDHVPGADLGAELAADADVQVDGADAHGVAGVRGVGDLVDAVDRANGHSRIAARTQVLIEDRKLFGKFFLFGHSVQLNHKIHRFLTGAARKKATDRRACSGAAR